MKYDFLPIGSDVEREAANRLFKSHITDPGAQPIPVGSWYEQLPNTKSAWAVYFKGQLIGAAWASYDKLTVEHFQAQEPPLGPRLIDFVAQRFVIIHQVAVDEVHRGQGLATELIYRCTQSAIDHDALFVAAVVSNHPKAVRPYQDLGYSILECQETLVLPRELTGLAQPVGFEQTDPRFRWVCFARSPEAGTLVEQTQDSPINIEALENGPPPRAIAEENRRHPNGTFWWQRLLRCIGSRHR